MTAGRSNAETTDETEAEDVSDVGRRKRVKRPVFKVRYKQAMAETSKNPSYYPAHYTTVRGLYSVLTRCDW